MRLSPPLLVVLAGLALHACAQEGPTQTARGVVFLDADAQR